MEPFMGGAADEPIAGAEKPAQGLVIAELLRPEAYPHVVHGLELVETHISWVILTGRYAYKIKKPVHYDFINSSTLKRRRRLCEEEFRLNQRLAPELYVDVVSIGRTRSGAIVGAAEGVIEYAVRMRQFDRSQELSSLLERRDVAVPQIADLAQRLAEFHREADVARPDTLFGDYDQIRDIVASNLGALASMSHNTAYVHKLNDLENWMHESLSRLRPSIEFRKLNGSVRECHGDLHARNIVRWEGRLLPFDCLEFDPMLRWIDTADEIAFLYMDLLGHGRQDLASVTISGYLEVCGDYECLRLLRFYAVHRALVRAKVDAIQIFQAVDPDKLRQAAARFEARLELAVKLTENSDPLLILMHGVSGSGKSWLSERLVPELAAVRIRSDLERKRIAGVAPSEHSRPGIGAGIYARDSTDRTYARLAECADHALAGGHNVIVDAAFLDGAQRRRFLTLAKNRGRRSLILACNAQRHVIGSRIASRAAAGRDPSDADLSVLERQCGELKPFTDEERPYLVDIDTTGLTCAAPVADHVRQLIATGSKQDTRPVGR
jgi:aminoglycoside phosphotransferase family enzyme/predicted kinase